MKLNPGTINGENTISHLKHTHIFDLNRKQGKGSTKNKAQQDEPKPKSNKTKSKTWIEHQEQAAIIFEISQILTQIKEKEPQLQIEQCLTKKVEERYEFIVTQLN